MAYDKKLSKSERKNIKATRRFTKVTGFRESEKHLSAIKHRRATFPVTVEAELIRA